MHTILYIYEDGKLAEVWHASARTIFRIGFHILRRARYMREVPPMMACSNVKIDEWLLEERARILEERYIMHDLVEIDNLIHGMEDLTK